MQRALSKHPKSGPSPVDQILVEAFRFEGGRVSFMFTATGDLQSVRVPSATHPLRRDELWRHTCFEAFIARPDGEPYIELNFAPSGAWAAYRFDRYRSGMTNLEMEPPEIRATTDRALMMTATAVLGLVPELVPWESWRLGMSAVVEAEDGSISYWALAHPPEKPDFHHPDCFAAQLAPDAFS